MSSPLPNALDTTTYSYAIDPYYNTFIYSRVVHAYSLFFGTFSTLGNFYMIFLFFKFSRLRSTQCNWLIIFLCISDVFIALFIHRIWYSNTILGIGTFIRPIVNMVVIDNNIIGLDFHWCTAVTAPWVCGYRVGQTIALLMALDRFLAIWKPTIYAKRQGNIKAVVIICAVIVGIVLCCLLFLFVYGADLSVPMTLQSCLGLSGSYYFQIVPSYSGIVSIIFFVTYISSLLMFTKQITFTKKQQAHLHLHISKVQSKIFITVSMALLFYTFFYVIPTIMQMLTKYFGLDDSIFNYAGYIIVYGAEMNGSLNAVIYLIKHQEFRECSMRVFYGIIGKTLHSEFKSSKVMITVKTVGISNVKNDMKSVVGPNSNMSHS